MEVPRIRSICRDIHRPKPALRLVAERSHQEAAAIVTEEVRNLRTLRADTAPITKPYPRTLEPMFSVCELATVQLIDLFAICAQRRDDEEPSLWPSKKGANGTFILEILADNLAGTLLGVRHLVIVGLDGQARVLLRWFVQLAEVLVAVSFDRTLSTYYVQHAGNLDESYDNWRKHLKPSKVRKVLKRFAHLSASRPQRDSPEHRYGGLIAAQGHVDEVHDLQRYLSMAFSVLTRHFLAQVISSVPFPATEDKAKVLGRKDH